MYRLLAVLVLNVNDPDGANDGGFRIFVILIPTSVLAAICEFGKVTVIVDALREHTTDPVVGVVMEQVEEPDGIISDGNVINNFPPFSIGEG